MVVEDCTALLTLEAILEDLSQVACWTSSPPSEMRSFFLGWRVRLLLRVVLSGASGYTVRRRRWSWDFLKYVITDTWNYGSALSHPRCACLFSSCTAFLARTLVHVAQSVPQLRAVPNAVREVFGSLTCHRDDTDAPGYRVARTGLGGHNCSQRVMVPRRHFPSLETQ